MNGAVIQSAAGELGLGRFNVNSKRPFILNGKAYVLNADGTARVAFHGNAESALRYEEWLDIDRTVIQVAAERLVGIADLRTRGLVHNLGSIGKTVSQWEEESDMTDAEISMDGVSGEEDRPEFNTARVPVPLIHKQFRVNFRELAASRALGGGLDVSAAAIATRKVAERSEDMLFAGVGINVGGDTIYGYTNHPDRNTVAMATDWAAVLSSNNDVIVNEVSTALDALRTDRFHGPYVMYIPGEYEGKLDEDYEPGSGDTRTLRERLLQLSGLQEIRVADRLTTGNVVVVQMTREVVDLAMAQDISTVQWSNNGGFTERFNVMAVWVPRLKTDFDGRMGVAHISL